MFLAGDEFCNTQFGNNNAYCQDNEISWLDWNRLQKHEDVFQFFKYMIQFRKEHDIIRKFSGSCSLGFPEIQVMEPRDDCKVLRVIYAGRNRENTGDEIICLAVIVFWEEQEFTLPVLGLGLNWYVMADTGMRYIENTIPKLGKEPLVLDGLIQMIPRSVCVFKVK